MGTGYAKFGNIQFTKGWSLDYQLGASPSVCTIRTVPHLNSLVADSDLILGETGNGELKIRDCKLATATLSPDKTWELPILDRRWKWQFDSIDGIYNIPRPDKTFIREKTPQELAVLCLRAMGETKWDIGRLPNFARPQVEWEKKNPASALDDLITSLGCAWTLDYFSDKVVVWPIGKGIDLPELPTINRSQGYSWNAAPDSIICYGGRTIYQGRFVCEAVGLDTDGKIKPMAKLSYKPLDYDEPEDFIGIDGTYDDHGETKDTKDLARNTCWRWYRITGLANGGWSPDELKSKPDEPKGFYDLDLLDTLAEQEVDENDIGPDGKPSGRKVNKRPVANVRMSDPDENESTPPEGSTRFYKGHFSVDTRLGIVKFSDPVYINDNDKAAAATVYVELGFNAGRDGIFHRPSQEIKLGGRQKTGPRVVVRDEIVQRIIQRYEEKKIVTTYPQPDTVDKDLKYWLDATKAEYTVVPSRSRHYYGLHKIVPDGRIRQVTWSAGDGAPPTTQVSMATEHNLWTPTPEDDRRKRVIDDLAKQQRQQRNVA